MQQFLTALIVASAVACFTSPASASLPLEETLSLETPVLIGGTETSTDTMLTQCYGGGYSYAPVYRSTRYYYPARRGGVSINIGGGGYRGYPGYYRGGGYRGGGYRGYGRPYGGFGPSIGFGGRSGVGLFLSF